MATIPTDWKAGSNPSPTALPGATAPSAPKPPLPGAGNVSSDHAVEEKWAAMSKQSKLALADMILQIDAHPEWLEWAKAARVSFEPGAQP